MFVLVRGDFVSNSKEEIIDITIQIIKIINLSILGNPIGSLKGI